MKKILTLTIVLSLLLTACGSAPETPSESAPEQIEQISEQEESIEETPEVIEPTTEQETVVESEPIIEEVGLDSEVKIILSAIITDPNQTIDEYVANLKEDNPDDIYEIYDDSHYALVITEKERREQIEIIFSEVAYEKLITQYNNFLSENELSTFVSKFDLKDDYSEVKIYVQNLDKMGLGGFAFYLGSEFYWGLVLDSIYAYQLVDINERNNNIIFINNDTKEIIEPFAQ